MQIYPSDQTFFSPDAFFILANNNTRCWNWWVLESIGNKFSSYTYSNVSVGFFTKAAELFKAYSDKLTFKVLDIKKAPANQSFESHPYHIIIASNVWHATASFRTT